MGFVIATQEMLDELTKWGVYPELHDSDHLEGEPKGLTYKMYRRTEDGTLQGNSIDQYLEQCAVWGIEPWGDDIKPPKRN